MLFLLDDCSGRNANRGIQVNGDDRTDSCNFPSLNSKAKAPPFNGQIIYCGSR